METKISRVAEKMEAEMKNNPAKYPFGSILQMQVGNPQLAGQKPITWYREVLSLLQAPHLLRTPRLISLYPSDAIKKAKEILKAVPGGLGAYSSAAGAQYFREKVKEYIEERDGWPCQLADIYLTEGATSALESILKLIVSSHDTGVLVPVPQHPLYTSILTLLGANKIEYYLSESDGWSINLEEIRKSLSEARKKGINPRAFLLVNPGNPTGSVLEYDDIVEVVKFCKEENLVLIADEVYQQNIHCTEKRFYSVKKVIRDLGSDYKNMEFISIHSTSKGYTGECGRRGGYMEVCGLGDFAKENLQKLQELKISPNTDGQVITALMLDEPKPGTPSYSTFADEKKKIMTDICKKATLTYKSINSLKGASCQKIFGSIYAYIRLELPDSCLQEAKEKGHTPDELYALSLLSATGIVSVPGIIFGQRKGEHFIRITFLLSYYRLKKALDSFKRHHQNFMIKYDKKQLSKTLPASKSDSSDFISNTNTCAYLQRNENS